MCDISPDAVSDGFHLDPDMALDVFEAVLDGCTEWLDARLDALSLADLEQLLRAAEKLHAVVRTTWDMRTRKPS